MFAADLPIVASRAYIIRLALAAPAPRGARSNPTEAHIVPKCLPDIAILFCLYLVFGVFQPTHRITAVRVILATLAAPPALLLFFFPPFVELLKKKPELIEPEIFNYPGSPVPMACESDASTMEKFVERYRIPTFG
jgi:hypothetical protein